MRPVLVGVVCLVAGLAIGATAMAPAGDSTDEPAKAPGQEQELDRGGHVLVFLEYDATEAERAAIEAAIEAEAELVADFEFWNAEASRAEALRLFQDDPGMVAQIEAGSPVPESYRLLLREPTRPNATIVHSRFVSLPGVVAVRITENVPELGDRGIAQV